MAEEFTSVEELVKACEDNFSEALKQYCPELERCLGAITISTFPLSAEDPRTLEAMDVIGCDHGQCPFVNGLDRDLLTEIRNQVFATTSDQFEADYVPHDDYNL